MIHAILRKRFGVTVLFVSFGVILGAYATNCGSGSAGGAIGSGTTAPAATSNTITPTPTPMVVAGLDHACASLGQRIQCWGRNQFGQLGNGTSTNSLTGTWVYGIDGFVTQVAAGDKSSCALVDGAVLCWGTVNTVSFGVTPAVVSGWDSSKNITAIAVGKDSVCAVVNGGVQCFGYNSVGELGRPGGDSATPDWVVGLGSGSGVVKLANSGGRTFCAETATNLYCWGYNGFGQLGLGGTGGYSVAATVVPGVAVPLSSLAASLLQICATNSTGTYCWGKTESATLQTAPALRTNIGTVGRLILRASPTTMNSCRLNAGILSCIGYKAYTFADGDVVGSAVWTLTPLTALGNNVISASYSIHSNPFACAMKSDASIVCWGSDNTYGQLGNGTTSNSAVPVAVTLAP